MTICTCDRTCFFGDVIDGKVDLSAIGQIAQLYWAEIPSHFEHTYIDVYAIMPNHVHGIVVIDRPHNVEKRHGASLHPVSSPQNPVNRPIKSICFPKTWFITGYY
ncbi:MAG: hypothetical protein ACR9NN_02115 [Nostochopsis sp.]